MSKFDYARTAATATRLLGRFGAAGAVRRSSTTGGNAWDPSSGTTTTTDYPATMVNTAVSGRMVNGTTVLATDRQILVAAEGLAIVPQNTDTIVTPDGQTLKVVPESAGGFGVQPLKPATTTILYTIHCRSA